MRTGSKGQRVVGRRAPGAGAASALPRDVRRRRPLDWSLAAIEELEGAGIDDRRGQAQALGVSLVHVDRLRRASRRDDDGPALPARGGRRAAPRRARAQRVEVQLGARVPASVAERLRRHAARLGVSAALMAAVALDDWLAAHGVPGPPVLRKKARVALGL